MQFTLKVIKVKKHQSKTTLRKLIKYTQILQLELQSRKLQG